MFNPYQQLRALFPNPPLQVGVVEYASLGSLTMLLDGGSRVVIRGEGLVGERLFFRDGVVEGKAPSLPYTTFDI